MVRKMRMFVNIQSVGFMTYIRCVLTELIWGYPFSLNREKESEITKCYICGKPLKKRRFELCIDRPLLNYESEFDRFLCVEHAIQTLLRYK